jgi:hypothetical protein
MLNRILFLCVACLGATLPSVAQTTFGRISGTITDPSGAAVAGAAVTIRNTDTQATRGEKTDDRGFYVAENLPIGPYAVEVDHPGFKRSAVTGLQVVADGRVTANIALEIGQITQNVEVVAASAEALNTVSGEVAHVVDQEQVDNLALNGRAYTELLTLVPGAIVTNPDQFGTLTSLSATNQSINGHRGNQNNLTVDGVGNLDNGSNGSLINNVSPDFLQEVKIQTSNFSSQYGRSAGASFNIMTKNGTNNLHGGLFEYLRNDALDARNFFSPTRANLRYNDWGYSLGGPIKKNKIFFFVGQEWRKIRQQTAGTRVTLPTLLELQGNFSEMLALSKPTIIYQPGTKTPFVNNIIPASRITPDGQAILNVYKTVIPMAAVYNGTSPTSNNATFQNPNPLDYREDLVRLDYRINDRHSLVLRFVEDFNSIFLANGPGGSLPITPEIRDRPGKSGLISETWIISPTIVNEARLGASWNSQHYWNQGDTWKRSYQGFTFQRVYNSVGAYVDGIPDVSFSTGTNPTGWTGPYHTLSSPTTQFEMSDTVSIARGEHSLRAGVMIIRNRKDQNGRSAYDGSISFDSNGNPNTTGYSFADSLLGNFKTYTEAAYDPIGKYRYTEPAAFVDDSWKISRRLTLNLGMRYEYMMAMYSTADNLAEFVPSLYNPAQAVKYDSAGNIIPGSGNIYNGLVRVANGVNPSQQYLVPNAKDPNVLAVPAGAPRGMYPSQSTWSPRVGLAFALDPKTVVRSGFGLYYDRIQGNPTFYTLNNPPYVGSAQFTNGNLASITAGASVISPWGTVQTIDPNLKIPYSQQFSFGIQRELPLSLFGDATYVGSLARHLLDEPDINLPTWDVVSKGTSSTNLNSIRPYQGYSTIQMFQSRVTANYHALQLHLTRRAGNVRFTAGYTFSKNLGEASSDTANNRNPYNVKLMYGPLDIDVTHAFVGTLIYNLPKMSHSSRFVRVPLGGWQVSGVAHVQSGFANSVTGSSSPISSRLADYVGGDTMLPDPGPNGWWNRAAFATAPYNRWGTAGAGTVRGPGMQIYNMSLTKFFYVTERINIRLRADFVNAFNHTNFNDPSANQTSSSYGTITGAYPSRAINLGVKLAF